VLVQNSRPDVRRPTYSLSIAASDGQRSTSRMPFSKAFAQDRIFGRHRSNGHWNLQPVLHIAVEDEKPRSQLKWKCFLAAVDGLLSSSKLATAYLNC